MDHKPFHHLLVACFSILSLYYANIETITAGDVLLSAAVSIASAALLFEGLRMLRIPPPKAALITSVVVVWFFSFGRLHSAIEDHFSTPAVRYALIGAAIALVPILSVATALTRRKLASVTAMANVMAVAACLVVVIQIAGAQLGPGRNYAALERASNTVDIDDVPIAKGPRPDVYYILLDMYSGEQALSDLFQFENTSLTGQLKSRGFVVDARSRSNYPYTFASMASTLNMQYNDRLARQFVNLPNSVLPLTLRIRANRVAEFLRRQGYAITIINAPDKELGMIDAVEQTSALSVGQILERNRSRAATLASFQYLQSLPASGGKPRFVYVHIYCPHPPFVFDASGNPVSLQQDKLATACGAAGRGKMYLDQLQFVNRNILTAIDHIRAVSAQPPIIIIQGDHGSHVLAPDTSPINDRLLEERFNILNAYYLPGGGKGILYPGITPVNSFRAIFDHYFGARYPMLPDRQFYATYAHPLAFTECTAQVRRVFAAPDGAGARAGTLNIN